jgi:glycosyltransferase involved in cell wall biosynthesis
MAAYNAAEYVEESVRSVLDQTFGDFEFLALDDGSGDGTFEVLASISDSRVRAFRHPHMGLTRSLMRGLSLAKGEFVARQDADDLSCPARLERQVAYMDAHPEVALVGSGVTVVSRDGRFRRDYLYPAAHEGLAAELEQIANPLPHTTIMFRREIVMDCGGYRETFPKAQDYDLYLRLMTKCRLASIPEPLCRLLYSMDSFTSDNEGVQFRCAVLASVAWRVGQESGVDPLESSSREDFLRRFGEWYETSAYSRIFGSRQLRRRGRLAWAERDIPQAIRCLWTAFRVEPGWLARNLGIAGAGSVPSEAVRWARAWRPAGGN